MADQKLVEILKGSVSEWNRFSYTQAVDWYANLRRANLKDAKLAGANLTGGRLSDADLIGARLKDADLTGADLRRADLTSADLRRADLGHANLRHADLRIARLRNANLRRANLIDTDFTGADLTGGRLSDADLTGADLRRADLIGADLINADLRDARLCDTNHTGANLIGANLSGADLTGANFSGANLIGANLSGANFSSADFSGAYLSDATLWSTLLIGQNLSLANGLTTIKHEGPSHLDNKTLSKSKGKIPDAFLRGCGFQNYEIVAAQLYDPDLTSDQYIDICYHVAELRATAPIQANPVFFSYTHADGRFVDELQSALDAKDVSSWRDIHHAEAGPLDKVINRAIILNPTMILVLSKASVKSEWVRWEVKRATRLEEELGRDVLCPIALDDAWRNCRWPLWLRERVEEYNVLDYSGEDAIKEQMPRLLKGLRIHYRDQAPE